MAVKKIKVLSFNKNGTKAPYSYIWSSNSPCVSFNPASGTINDPLQLVGNLFYESDICTNLGEVKLELTDSNGCKTFVNSFPISDCINFFCEIEDIDLKNLKFKANVNGGNAPYVYEWETTNNFGIKTNLNQLVELELKNIQNGCPSGVLYLKVTDSNDCISRCQFDLSLSKIEVEDDAILFNCLETGGGEISKIYTIPFILNGTTVQTIELSNATNVYGSFKVLPDNTIKYTFDSNKLTEFPYLIEFRDSVVIRVLNNYGCYSDYATIDFILEADFCRDSAILVRDHYRFIPCNSREVYGYNRPEFIVFNLSDILTNSNIQIASVNFEPLTYGTILYNSNNNTFVYQLFDRNLQGRVFEFIRYEIINNQGNVTNNRIIKSNNGRIVVEFEGCPEEIDCENFEFDVYCSKPIIITISDNQSYDITNISTPNFGNITNNGDNTLTYIPTANYFNVSDTITYTLTNSDGIECNGFIKINLKKSSVSAGRQTVEEILCRPNCNIPFSNLISYDITTDIKVIVDHYGLNQSDITDITTNNSYLELQLLSDVNTILSTTFSTNPNTSILYQIIDVDLTLDRIRIEYTIPLLLNNNMYIKTITQNDCGGNNEILLTDLDTNI